MPLPPDDFPKIAQHMLKAKFKVLILLNK